MSFPKSVISLIHQFCYFDLIWVMLQAKGSLPAEDGLQHQLGCLETKYNQPPTVQIHLCII